MIGGPLALDDREVDRLYGLSLKDFVAERNALAKRLKAAGDADAAEAARVLSKPTLSAWAINQLVRQRRDLVADLVAALDRVRAAQLGALEGKEDAPSLSEAVREEREAMARLDEAAPEILAEAGYVASKAITDRALRTLRAAAADPQLRSDLEHGRLVEDVEPAGFDGLAAQLGPPVSVPRAAPRNTIDLELETVRREAALKREQQEERRRQEEERRAADERRLALQKKLDALRRSQEAAREAETRLEREHNQAERDRQEAERRLREAERLALQIKARLDEARAQREEAEAQAEAIRVELRPHVVGAHNPLS